MDEGERAAELRRRLWNDDVGAGPTSPAEGVLEQYRLYVEMADRVSQRRALSNTFFLTLNAGAVAVLGSSVPQWSASDLGWLALPCLALLVQCVAWFGIVRSYRLLNTAKYEVVGALEERLPASPYWRAEWWILGQGADRRRYWPLSHLEQVVPVVFALLYAVGAGVLLATAT